MPRNSKLKLKLFVADMVDSCIKALNGKLPQDQARNVALQAAQDFCFRNAKSTVYVPAAQGLQNMERNWRIWQDYQRDGDGPQAARKFTPQRVLELAAEHDLSPQQIYNICRKERETEAAATQAA